MIRLLVIIRIAAPLIASGIWAETRARLADITASLRYQRSRWVTGCGRHVAATIHQPRLLVRLTQMLERLSTATVGPPVGLLDALTCRYAIHISLRSRSAAGSPHGSLDARPHALVPLLSLCDLPETPWPRSMPLKASGEGWDWPPWFRLPAYVYAPGRTVSP